MTALRVTWEPVLDAARGVPAGYAASSGAGVLSPAAVARALNARATLPANTFLSLRMDRATAATSTVRAALLRPSDLAGVVLDVRGRSALSCDAVLGEVRDSGGLIALHATDIRAEGFDAWRRTRPAFVVLDPTWTHGVAHDRRAADAVRALGELADQQDAWLQCTGVSRREDFELLVDLGVPLISGPFVGAAADAWPTLASELQQTLRPHRPRPQGPLRALVGPTPTALTVADAQAVVAAAAPRERSQVAVVDGAERPWAVAWRQDGAVATSTDLLRVNVDTALRDVIARAAGRSMDRRQEPVVLIDNAGRLLSVVANEVLSRLACELDAPIPDLSPDTVWLTITDARR